MKQVRKYMYVMLLFIIAACTKDSNNFSYEEPFDFQISDDIEGVIQIRQGEILSLTPHFDDSNGDYSYLWFAWPNTGALGYNNMRDTLGTAKELTAEIRGSYYIVGVPYKLTFKVTDNRTGVSDFYFYDLNITNVYSEGWMVLEDRNGQADFSMLLPDGDVIRQIYSSINPNHLITQPLMLGLSSGSVNDDIDPLPVRKFYIAGKNDAVELDVLTMQKKADFDFLFFQPPPVTQLSFIGWSGTSLGVIINEKLLCTNFVGGFPGAKKFGLYMQAPELEYDYEIAPFVANIGEYDWRAHPVVYQHIMYDQKNKRFYNVTGENLNTFPTNASNTSIFNMNDVGLTMKYMASSNTSNAHNAIMYEGAQAYLLQFSSLTTDGNPIITQSKRIMTAPYILETSASSIASSTLSGHIFYGYENTLYRYAINSNTTNQVHTFTANEEIINVKFRMIRTADDESGQLLVATWDGQESKLYDFAISATGAIAESGEPAKGGFDRVVDMVYKNVN
ncbi:hypothetical protein FXV77_19185 [Sphingobacterium phlebotomi]|uniref:PKD family protein n=1 Tax=Sphingobacterium phlebotomi TaxID=2605433 RepID=A0A5D4GZB4_9SPHI|nr:PKD-like family lipoprotein [Sphingobacterium phlebotomi]TYR32555.1 hypothetical protein FXV77_19185 [Sphingobacterium phlebotomi]